MTDTITATILGCGSSGGVPRVGNDWGLCDPLEPRNRRLRCSLLVERRGADGTTRVLIDTGPDMRQQLLTADVQDLDAVLYTHAHADHLHGIDDLRGLAIRHRKRIPVFMDAATSTRARAAFAYCFDTPPGSSYPPILDLHGLIPDNPCRIDGAGGPLDFTPFEVVHGEIMSLGFLFNNTVYLPDVSDITPEAAAHLQALDVLILDALRRTPHPSHFSLQDAVDWISRLRPKHAILTNMHNDLDYATLMGELPAGVEPAYDGMTIERPLV
ncbi:MAG: MBL fold metallo-hydrolase [Roseibium sp.]|nr:MBL fold metallo-hydrolase [Roseibium sp.]